MLLEFKHGASVQVETDYEQTSTVLIYNRLLVITDGNNSTSKLVFRVLFTTLPLVNSPCFHTSMHFTRFSLLCTRSMFNKG